MLHCDKAKKKVLASENVLYMGNISYYEIIPAGFWFFYSFQASNVLTLLVDALFLSWNNF